MHTLYHNVPDPLAANEIPKAITQKPSLWITEEATAAQTLKAQLHFFHPRLKTIILSGWDGLPYDRMSPKADICAERMTTLAELANQDSNYDIIITTVNACLQRLPPMPSQQTNSLWLKQGQEIRPETLIQFLESQAFERTDNVRIASQYGVRGSLLDVFPAGSNEPCRIDFLGDTIDKIRLFDPLSQLSTGEVPEICLRPAREVLLNADNCERFCRNYRNRFGDAAETDPLFQAIQNRQEFIAMEHWLACFYEQLHSGFDYARSLIFPTAVRSLARLRFAMIEDHYQARLEALQANPDDESPYRPMPPDSLYLSEGEFSNLLENYPSIEYFPFTSTDKHSTDLGGKGAENFNKSFIAKDSERALFSNLKESIAESGVKRVIISCYSQTSLERLQALLHEHALGNYPQISQWTQIRKYAQHKGFVSLVPFPRGFISKDLLCLSEADIFGEKRRPIPTRSSKRRGDAFIREVSALNIGDLAVHEEHGIGRFCGLETLSVDASQHECALLEYAEGAKLYLPVENIEMLSRYGGEDMHHPLDSLGQASWQARKAKVKKRLKDMSEKLLAMLAARQLCEMPRMHTPAGDYEEFSAAFAYPETDDQLTAIDDVLQDLQKGKPMDRLICGDTGFGKTEIALRAAFLTAYNSGQVAVIAPTTLLARQHFINFSKRFQPFAINVKMLSRLCTPKEKKQVKANLEDGSVDIVIGTHALLHKNIKFKNLKLAIIDEEQHFGVKQKQRLKDSGADIHILTLTATPIPRTLQMALHGLQEMSIIATPPVDRLAVHSFHTPYDPILVREAIMRERLRGGQIFAVVPRISDLRHIEDVLTKTVPDLTIAKAHGQLPASALEQIMSDFIDRKYQALLCTHIIESGIDIPNANTMFIFRPEMFALSQLYQLRGRIGRSNRRGYCYMVSEADKILNKNAKRRLEIMQTLDTVGAGFTLASYDMDIRGAGNLLGEEQSGHIREVGVELFQKMLGQAVREAETQQKPNTLGTPEASRIEGDFSPSLNLGVKVVIPTNYIPDFNLRLNFYQRLAGLEDAAELKPLAAELKDRFGAFPPELDLLFAVTKIKVNCKQAGIAKIIAGHRGATLHFHKREFANPEGLINFLKEQQGSVKLQPDHSLSVLKAWQKSLHRLRGLDALTEQLANIAQTEADTNKSTLT